MNSSSTRNGANRNGWTAEGHEPRTDDISVAEGESLGRRGGFPLGERRSSAIFALTFVTVAFSLAPRILLLAFVVAIPAAFAVTESLARRFPDPVPLRWLFRPNVLSYGVAASLFILSIFLLRNVAAICIEGGTVLGFPWPFYHQCFSPGGGADPASWSLVGLLVDVAIWYVLGTLIASLVRPRKELFAILA
jgi:hypothetical protein